MLCECYAFELNKFPVFNAFCQALSVSQSLNLSLSLRDRDRADTIHYNHVPPPHHQHLLLGDLNSSVIHLWNRQLKPY